jgi:hypothetical protein
MSDLLIGHTLMQLWQKIFVILTNIAIYERGFFPNKSHSQGSLKLDTLNALMRVSLCNIEMDNKYGLEDGL